MSLWELFGWRFLWINEQMLSWMMGDFCIMSRFAICGFVNSILSHIIKHSPEWNFLRFWRVGIVMTWGPHSHVHICDLLFCEFNTQPFIQSFSWVKSLDFSEFCEAAYFIAMMKVGLWAHVQICGFVKSMLSLAFNHSLKWIFTPKFMWCVMCQPMCWVNFNVAHDFLESPVRLWMCVSKHNLTSLSCYLALGIGRTTRFSFPRTLNPRLWNVVMGEWNLDENLRNSNCNTVNL